ncbi:MAG: ATP-binding protein [Patescibacteria group bacterium]
MTEKEIIELIKKAKEYRSETHNIEFKDARGGIPGDLWRPISAFSNTPGDGVIVFGITEDRKNDSISIVGNLDLAFLQERILSYIKEKMDNVGSFDLKIVEFENKSLLALIILEAKDEIKPCFNKKLGLPNGACIRTGNNDRVITDIEMRTFIRNSSVFKYDKTRANETTIKKLNLDKIKKFLSQSAIKTGRLSANNNPTNEVLANLGIIDKFGNQLLPTFGGFMIFSTDHPQLLRPFSRFVVRCVRYKGASVASPIIDKIDITGTLDQQIDLIQQFILRNISLKANIEGTKRIERYEYPEDAIRELVANAVIHRDYMITETYTQINIFSNRIEIYNPGNLPPGVTIDNIKDSQFSRNEIIAAILKDMEYLEEYGRGINIVFSKMREWNLLDPIFKNMSNSFRVILLGEMFKKLNDRQVGIWNALQDREKITSKECNKLFPSVSKATIATDLNKLEKVGLIESKGASYNTYYEAIY